MTHATPLQQSLTQAVGFDNALDAFIEDCLQLDTCPLPKDATKQYNKVIELYPNSTWAVQAKQALHLVGKSDEELLRFLKEKNPS